MSNAEQTVDGKQGVWRAERYPRNPVITRALSPTIGDNMIGTP